ncbi:MAG: hypothetical protein U1F43_00885 [Myxococcota bacterium]
MLTSRVFDRQFPRKSMLEHRKATPFAPESTRSEQQDALGLDTPIVREEDEVSQEPTTEPEPEPEPELDGESADVGVLAEVSQALRGKVKELKLVKSGPSFRGVAKLDGLGDFSDRACTITATKTGEDWSVRAHARLERGKALLNAQATVMVDGGKMHLAGRGRLRPIGLFDAGEFDIAGDVGDDGQCVLDLGSLHGKMRLPAGFEGGESSFHGVRLDLMSGIVDATSGDMSGEHHLLGKLVGKDMKIVGSTLSGHLDLTSAKLRIPPSSGMFEGTVNGKVDIIDGAWSLTELGGHGTVKAPGSETGIDILFTLELGPDGVGAIKANLDKPVDLTTNVSLEQLDLDVDLNTTHISAVGRAKVHDLPGFAPSMAKFEAYSREGLMRVTVDRIALDVPKIGDIDIKGEAKQLVYANAGLGFSTNDVTLEATLPYIGNIKANSSVSKSQLQQTEIRLKRPMRVPSASPILEGDLDSVLLFDGTRFTRLDARLPMSLLLGTERLDKALDLVFAIDPLGSISASAALKSAIRLSKFMSVSGGQLIFDEKTGLGGNLDFEFHDIAGAAVTVPMPVQSKESERSVLSPKPGQDAFAYQLEAGYSTTRGPFLEGHVHFGSTSRSDAAGGHMFVPASALMGKGGASYELSVAGLKLMDEAKVTKRLVNMPKKRFKIIALPLGGIFAEAGAELDFSIAADPILADVSGRITDLDLFTLTPGAAILSAHVQGGLTGRMIGRPSLGVGAYMGSESIARLSGGLRMDIPAVLHGSLPGQVELGLVGGKLQAKGAVNPRLFFGMAATPVPYYDLSLFGGAISRAGQMAALPTMQIVEEQQVAELELSFGSLDKPKPAAEGFDFTLAKSDGSVPVPPPEVQTMPPTEVAPEKSEVSGSSDGAFGGGVWASLEKVYGNETWFQYAQKALDFIQWVSKTLAISESELQAALDFLKEYIDLKALDDRFFSNFKRPDGKAGKMGLVQALARVVFGRGDGEMHAEKGRTEESTEVTLDSDRVHELRFGLATVRVKQAATPGKVLLVHSPFHEGGFEILQDESSLVLDERNRVTSGVLAAKLALGGWGGFDALHFPVNDKLVVETAFGGETFKGGDNLAKASVVMPGEVSGKLVMGAGTVSRVDLNQSSSAGLPNAVGGVSLKSPPTKVGFVNRDGAWSLSAANGVTVPFEGGQFTAKLEDYSVSDLGISAKGVLFMDAGHIGRAGGNVTIQDNIVKQAELGFERPQVSWPESNAFVGGQLEGGLKIKDGSMDEARVGMKLSVRTSMAELEPVGTFQVRFAKVGDVWNPAFEAIVDESVVSRMKLGDYGQMRHFETNLTPEGLVGATGRFDIELPKLGKLENAELGYQQGVGLKAAVKVPMENKLMQGDLSFEYLGGKVTIGGKGKFSPPGLQPFDGELEVGTQRIKIKVDPKQDILNVKFGDSTLTGSVEELFYDRTTGAYAGRMRMAGKLPIVGDVSGEASLGNSGDPEAPFVNRVALRFKNPEFALPEKNPAIKGKLGGELSYGPKGVGGTILGQDLKLDVPGVGEGAELAFEGSYNDGVPSGLLVLKAGKKAPGSFVHLHELGGKLEKDGSFAAAGKLSVDVGSAHADLAARVDDQGFAVAAQNISFGEPGKDRFWGSDIAVGYDSALGLYLRARRPARQAASRPAWKLDYSAAKAGGKKTLSAEATVSKVLYAGSGTKNVPLPGLGPFTFLVAPIIPGFLDIFGEVAAEASLAYNLSDIVLDGKANVLGLDLATGAFESASLAPTVRGGVVVDLMGGPSFGLLAGVGGGWAAYAKGTVGFMVGGRARMHPRIDGLLTYSQGKLSGGASLAFPLYMSAVGIPKVAAEVGIFGGRFKKRIEGQLDEIMLMEPRQIMNLQAGMGALAEPGGPKDLAGAVPSNPLQGPRGSSVPKGVEIDTSTKKEAPSKFSDDERAIAGKAGDTDLKAHKGLFSLDDARVALTNNLTSIKDFISSSYDALKAIGGYLVGIAGSQVAKAKVSLQRTADWVATSFGYDVEAAKRAVFSKSKLDEVEHIDEYEGLKSELELIRKHHAEHHDDNEKLAKGSSTGERVAMGLGVVGVGALMLGGKGSDSDSDGKGALLMLGIAMIGGGLLMGVMSGGDSSAKERLKAEKHALSMAEALNKDIELAQGGDDKAERMAIVGMAKLAMVYAAAPILKLLRPARPGQTVWDAWKDGSGKREAMRAAMLETGGNINEFWKTATPDELQAWKAFLVECMGYSTSQIAFLAEAITRTYYSGWVGGWGNKVRENFQAVGILSK